MDLQSIEWKPVNKKKVFSTRVFDINEITSQSPENQEKTFYTLHATDWVIVIPVIENKDGEDSFLMVKQWRHGAAQVCIEFPGGVIDKGEEPEAAAARELHEETGFTARKITYAATISPNPAIMDNKCHIFFARDLENTHTLHLDDDEFLSAEPIPVSKVIELMGQRPYTHGLMCAALFLYIQQNNVQNT